MSESALRIAVVYPELLGTYGDGGNGEVLAARLRWRGLAAELVPVPAGQPLPASCDIYLLGGGEDEPQVLASEGIGAGGVLTSAVSRGAVCLAVCAGFQILGETFPGADGAVHSGVGMLAVETRKSFDDQPAARAVGDVLVEVGPELADVGALMGYENHGGRTRPLPGAPGRPLGHVRLGVGNGTSDGAEGWVAEVGAGVVFATYLHGPVLAQNPALADRLLARATGRELRVLEPEPAAELRAARLRTLSGL